jgi:hypothetical protein
MPRDDRREPPRDTRADPPAVVPDASIETMFAKLNGRQPCELERERLYRLRDALGLRDNDAFWSIVMALEHYDALLRQYPATIAAEAEKTLEHARSTFAAAAAKEASEAQRVVATTVAQANAAIASRSVARPFALHHVTLVLATIVAFGALCVHAGYDLASSGAAPYGARATDLHGASRAVATVLSIPAGWMLFAFLLPAAAAGAKAGCNVARDPLGDWREKAVGGAIVALCLASALACAVLLARIT